VFSDKTGTLTSNEMQLRQIAIRGITYGSPTYRCSHALICCSPTLPQFFIRWSALTVSGVAGEGNPRMLAA